MKVESQEESSAEGEAAFMPGDKDGENQESAVQDDGTDVSSGCVCFYFVVIIIIIIVVVIIIVIIIVVVVVVVVLTI